MLSVAATVTACQAGDSPRAARDKSLAVAVASAVAKPPSLVNAPTPVPAEPTAHAAPNPNGVEWRGAIEWHDWNEGLGIARKSSKPIMVVVYADWCPHCRALGPVFADPEIESLSK